MQSITSLRLGLLAYTNRLHKQWIRPMRVQASALQVVLTRARLSQHEDDPLASKILEALGIIDGVLSRYGEEKVAISFNGGKDCTVLIHLMATCLYARHRNIPLTGRLTNGTTPHPQTSPSITNIMSGSEELYPKIPAIYITAPSPFEEIEEFVDLSAEVYNMKLVRLGGGMKNALATFLEGSTGKGVEAVLVGTRRGDPHGADLETLSHTDGDWPSFMRVHPILDWSYQNVWEFLRELQVPYCTLYDEGYTSLGSTDNTQPNPCLKNPETRSGFDPAWKLEDESLERCGRGDPVRPGKGQAPAT